MASQKCGTAGAVSAMAMMAAAAALIAGCGGPEPAPPAAAVPGPLPGRPNVVLIMFDALRADKLGCYGFSEPSCPELDALAARGVLFERVVAQCSWTRPSVGSMLTGQYPRSLGLYKELGECLPGRAETLAELLKAGGYTTIGATANPNTNSVFGFDQGFDACLDSHAIWSWMKPMVTGNDYAIGEETRLAPATGLFRWVRERIGEGQHGPYYVQLLLMETHEYHRGPLSLTREAFRGQFADSPDAAYLQAVRQVTQDACEFIAGLRALPGWENTLFILTSDHGEGLSSHPHVTRSKHHGALLYESHLLVPLILYHPRGELGAGRVTRPVRLLDLAPSLLDYLGFPVPRPMQGVSLMPLLRGGQTDVDLPPCFVSETSLRVFEKAAVLGHGWNYIENRDGHEGLPERELQQAGIPEDGALTDQAAAHPDVLETMRAYLRGWEQRVPRAAPEMQAGGLSGEEYRQLKSIGYL